MVSASSTASKPFPMPVARPKQIILYSELEAAHNAQVEADRERARLKQEEKLRVQAEVAEQRRIAAEVEAAEVNICLQCGSVYKRTAKNRTIDCCANLTCKKARVAARVEALKAEYPSYEKWLEATLAKAGPEEKGIARMNCVQCKKEFVVIGSNGFNGNIASNSHCSQQCKNEKSVPTKSTQKPKEKVAPKVVPAKVVVDVIVKQKAAQANVSNRLKPTHFELLAEKLAKDAEANRAAQEKYIRENYRVEIKTVEPVKNIVAPKKHSHHLNRNLSTAIVGWTQAPKILKPTRKTICPHPFKKVHVTKEKALEFIAEHHSEDKWIHPYKCECGAIHIGH